MSVDGSYDETSSYRISRIFQFDFDVHYALRLKRFGEKVWKDGRERVVRKASERDARLQAALESNSPIYCRYDEKGTSHFYALVLAIEDDWVMLQPLKDDGTKIADIEATRKSKILLKVGPLDEPMAWLMRHET